MSLPDYDHPKESGKAIQQANKAERMATQSNDKPEGYVFGRPTAYRPEMCERVIEYGRQGKSHVQIACELDVTRETLYQWADTHSDFSDAIKRARLLAQAWFENKGQTGLETPGFNASLWAKQVSCRFPDDYREVTRQELTGKDGQPIRVKREASDFSDEELAAIAAGSGSRTSSEA